MLYSPHIWYLLRSIILFNLCAGLLAGLHEFPTSANVSGISASAQIKIPHTILSKLLQSPPSPYTTSSFFTPRSESSASSSTGLRISKIKPAGDVIHVFSHIRKTYRVQWVVLKGGGSEPPPLAPSIRRNEKFTKTGRKDGAKGRTGATEAAEPLAAKWISIDKVTDAKYVTLFTISVRY
jgi:A/G-specific adenine glycosylase